MPALEVLSLRARLSGSLSASLANCGALRRIEIVHNPDSQIPFGPSTALTTFEALPLLEALRFSRVAFTGQLGAFQLPNLLQFSAESLIVPSFNLNWMFAANHRLTHLHVDGIGAYGSIDFVSQLPKLRRLFISQSAVSGSITTDSLPPLLEAITILNSPVYLTLNSSIGLLSNLTTLEVNSVARGTIPEAIGDCTALSVLNLVDSQLSGPLPSSIGRLKKLASLTITSKYRLTGSLPPAIGDLPSLRQLRLPFNAISGSFPPSFANLKLDFLDLQSNRLEGTIPNFLANPGCVADLSRNLLSGHIPVDMASKCSSINLANNELGPLVSSTDLSIYGLESSLENFLYDSEPSLTFASNLHLATLDLSNNNFECPLPLLPLPPLPSEDRTLQVVRMENNGFFGQLLESYCNVAVLDLSRNHLRSGLNAFLTCAGESVSLASNDFAESIEFDGNNTKLVQLDLSGNQLTIYKFMNQEYAIWDRQVLFFLCLLTLSNSLTQCRT